MEIISNHFSVVNVHPVERVISVAAGGALALSGLSRGRAGIVRILTGAAMIQRGVTGRCRAYQLLGFRTAPNDATIPYELGIRTRASTTVGHPRGKIFEFWRELENLPRFMRHLISVDQIDERRSHWVAQGQPNKKIEWDAEIINEIPGKLIGWKSLPGGDVDSAGSVEFRDAPGGRGTEIHVKLQYNPPAGIVGSYVARLFGREPEQEISADLRRLKQFLEAGEVATTEGQPEGAPQKRKGSVTRVIEEAFA